MLANSYHILASIRKVHMKKFGIRFNGLEEPIEELIKNHTNLQTSDNYVAVEIGSAGCYTLKAIHDIISENRKGPFASFGFDIPTCGLDNINDLIVNFAGKPNIIRREELNPSLRLNYGEMYLFLLADPQSFLKDYFPSMIDLCHIDAVHSKPFVIKDFETIENKMRSGGLIFLHDFCQECQGTDIQIDGNPIQVREAVKELGLLDGTRKNWEFVCEIPGSRTTKTGTMDGNGLRCVKKL